MKAALPIDMQHIAAPLFLLWIFLLLLALLRRDFAPIWKLSALLVLLFYLLLHWQELHSSWLRYRHDILTELFSTWKALFHLLPVVLLLAWPLSLVIAYNHPIRPMGERILRNMALLTLFYWLFWSISAYTSLDLEAWIRNLYSNLYSNLYRFL